MTKRFEQRIVFFTIIWIIALFSSVCTAATSSLCLEQALDKYNGIRPSYQHCIDHAANETSAWVDCSNIELQYQNNRLNKAYQKLMSRLDGKYQMQLRDDERLWIKYRNTTCANTIYGIDQPGQAGQDCTLEKTARRASDIEALLFLRQLSPEGHSKSRSDK